MIFGIGIDIAEVARFKKWLLDAALISRYFNKKEIEFLPNVELTDRQLSALSQRLAVRFAAKEAFSKALGTGLTEFELKDVYVLNDSLGKPYLVLENSALSAFEKIVDCKIENAKIHISLSHEKDYAVANVIIEK